MNESFTTYCGIEFIPTDIQTDNIDIKDIAHSLSRICRFNGHIESFYSVAQHCIKVAEQLKSLGCEESIQLCGLLHDAAEAYLGDIPTPVKRYLRDYSNLELKYQKVILERFNLLNRWSSVYSLIKKIDNDVLVEEWRFLNEHNSTPPPGNVVLDSINKIEKDYLNIYYMLFYQLDEHNNPM